MRAEESRVLVVAPVGRDAEAMAAMLRGEGVRAEAYAGAEACLESLERGAGAVVMTEEALELPGAEALLESFCRQPAWSELPLIVLTSGGESRFARLLEIAVEVTGGVTLLERPMRAGTLLHSVQVALRSRRRQHEVRELLAERERFRALVTATSDAVYRMSADWKQMLHLQGKGFLPDTETASDQWLERYIPAEDHPQVRAAVQQAIRTHAPFGLEHRVLRLDGTLGWTFSRAVPVLNGDGEIVEWFGAASDITERKRAEEALRRSEARLAQAVRVGGVGTFEHDHGSDQIEYSPVLRELLGLREGEVTLAAFLNKVLVEDRGRLAESIRRAHDPAGEGAFEAEYRVAGPGGKIRWLSVRSHTFFEGERRERRPVRTIGAVLEVTERKERQAELERLVAERTAKLQELVGELEHFSYTITHDLKSPLRAMRGFAEVATLTCGPSVQKQAREALARISTSAERMESLITDALNYSRAVRQELPLTDVDTGALLRGMLDSYPELQPSRAEIRLEGELPLVLGNEAGLTQCFSNLLGNAVKFAKPGERARVRVWAEVLTPGQHEGWTRIWVEDQGIGISREMLPRVFDMFSRGSKAYQGTGIGLALVRKVVQRMGGRVGVESEEGCGSRFWVELKLGKARPSERPAEPAPPEPRSGLVLYVEDEENDAFFMKMAFAEAGLESAVRVVGDGRAALEYLSGAGKYADRKEYPLPSVVLLDLNLPQVPGFEVLKWMRNHPDFARTPVVVFSSSSREDDRTRARELGANEFVAKPSSATRFGEVVQRLRSKWMQVS